ncbi:MAG: hypothetical protein ACSLE5_11695 [Porticoccaceae bacterium]
MTILQQINRLEERVLDTNDTIELILIRKQLDRLAEQLAEAR